MYIQISLKYTHGSHKMLIYLFLYHTYINHHNLFGPHVTMLHQCEQLGDVIWLLKTYTFDKVIRIYQAAPVLLNCTMSLHIYISEAPHRTGWLTACSLLKINKLQLTCLNTVDKCVWWCQCTVDCCMTELDRSDHMTGQFTRTRTRAWTWVGDNRWADVSLMNYQLLQVWKTASNQSLNHKAQHHISASCLVPNQSIS